MNARRLGLLFGLAALAVAAPRWMAAQGELGIQPAPTYNTEGRDPYPFTAACSSSSWTQVVSTDTIARSTLLIGISSNTAATCLIPVPYQAPAPSTSTVCLSTTAAVQFPSGIQSALTDYSRAAWYCKASAGFSGTTNICGYRARDRGDFGRVGNTSGY